MANRLKLCVVSFIAIWAFTACDDSAEEKTAGPGKGSREAAGIRTGGDRGREKGASQERRWDPRRGGDDRYQEELKRRTAALGGPARMPYLTDPFDEEKLRSDLEEFGKRKKAGDAGFQKYFMAVRYGIERLTSDQNPEFDEALQDSSVREDENLRPYLLAYDFQVMGDRLALDQLLEAHRDRGQGDSDSLAALKNIDEWEETAKSLYGPNANFDGAGGEALAIFINVRQALYPENFEIFEELICGLERTDQGPQKK